MTENPVQAFSFAPRTRWAMAMLGGLAAAITALLLGLFAVSSAGSDWQLLIPCAALGAFAVTTAGFWLLLGLGRRLRAWMGVLAGAVLGVVAHAAMWYLSFVAANLLGVRSSLGEAPVDLWTGLWACWAYAAFSLLLVGWVSVPLSAIIGGLFAKIVEKRIQNAMLSTSEIMTAGNS